MEIKIDKLVRTNRKTYFLQITADASLVVRVPKKASTKQINEILNQKRSWIIKKITQAKDRMKTNKPKQFIEGENFLFMGREYTLLLSKITGNGNNSKIYTDGENIIVPEKFAPHMKEALINWYKYQSHIIIPDRVANYANIFHIKYKNIKITSAQTRWGSCSGHGNLNFSWRLMMAPLEVIDYVVVHELAHINIKNHSANFWNKVASMYADYTKCKNWLRENQSRLPL